MILTNVVNKIKWKYNYIKLFPVSKNKNEINWLLLKNLQSMYLNIKTKKKQNKHNAAGNIDKDEIIINEQRLSDCSAQNNLFSEYLVLILM